MLAAAGLNYCTGRQFKTAAAAAVDERWKAEWRHGLWRVLCFRSASAASEHGQAVKPAVLRAFAWGLVNPRSPAAGSLASCHLAGQSVVVILMGCSAGLSADADLL